MLTKSDLSAIQTIVTTSIQTQTPKIVKEIVSEELVPIKKDLKVIKTRLKKVEKTVDTIAKVFDRADVSLHKRVKRIETHLNLSPQAA